MGFFLGKSHSFFPLPFFHVCLFIEQSIYNHLPIMLKDVCALTFSKRHRLILTSGFSSYFLILQFGSEENIHICNINLETKLAGHVQRHLHILT